MAGITVAAAFLSIAVSTTASAHECGPSPKDVKPFDLVRYDIKADVSESTESEYDYLTLDDESIVYLLEKETMPFERYVRGPYWFIVKPPPLFPYLSENTLVWEYDPNEASGFCFADFNIVDPDAPPERPTPTTANENDSADEAHPVNTANGEVYHYEQPIFSFPGPVPLVFEPYYASGIFCDGHVYSALGGGWMHNFDLYMKLYGSTLNPAAPPDFLVYDRARIVLERGKVLEFEHNGVLWELAGNREIPFQLVAEGSDYVLLDPRTRHRYRFNYDGLSNDGRLVSISDRNGNEVALTWDASLGNQRLLSASNNRGQTISFTYQSFERLATVSDGTHTVSFGHNFSNELLSISDPRNPSWTTNFSYYSTLSPEVGGPSQPLCGANFGNSAAFLRTLRRPLANVTDTFSYNDNGMAVQHQDALGHMTSFSYDGRTTMVTLPDMESFEQEHDGNLQLTRLTDENGAVSEFSYDPNGQRETMDFPGPAAGGIVRHGPSGYVSSETDASGNTITYTYESQTDGIGLNYWYPSHVTYPDGTSESFTYDGLGNLTSVNDRIGGAWTYTLNSDGYLLTSTNPLGGVTTFTYHPAMRTPVTATDHAGNTTTFTYDALGRLGMTTYADSSTRVVTYDGRGQVLSRKDPDDFTSVSTYDANGNMDTVVGPDGRTRCYQYDANDRLVALNGPNNTDPCNAPTSGLLRGYDSRGQLASLGDRSNRETTFDYDPRGNLSMVTDQEGMIWSYSYDSMNHLESQTDPLNQMYHFAFDALNRLVWTETEEGRATHYGYDSLGNITRVTGPSGEETTYSYLGDLPTMVDRGQTGVVSHIDYNMLGQPVRITDGEGGEREWSYDMQGRLVARTDALDRSTIFTYDNRNRVSGVTYPGGMGSGSFSYDSRGNLTMRSFSDGTVLNYGYDSLGRPDDSTGATLSYDHEGYLNESSGITCMRDPNSHLVQTLTLGPGMDVNYTYDDRGSVRSVTDWTGYQYQFSYLDNGLLDVMTRSNGVNTHYGYDGDSRITRVQHQNGMVVADIQITRDASGNLLTENRNCPLDYDFSTSHLEMRSFDAAAQNTGCSYDPRGFCTDDGTFSYDWNLGGFLDGYTNGSTITVTIERDAFGQMTERTKNGVTERFTNFYGFENPAISVVKDDLDVPTCYYIHDPRGFPLGYVDPATGDHHSLHFDQKGNTIAVTDPAGSVCGAFAYSPYGMRQSTGDCEDLPYTFGGGCGYYSETESLCNANGRYYDAWSQSFIQPGPAFSSPASPGLLGLNENPRQSLTHDPLQNAPRTYAAGNPVNRVHQGPAGQASQLLDKALTANTLVGWGAGVISQADGFVNPSAARSFRFVLDGTPAPANAVSGLNRVRTALGYAGDVPESARLTKLGKVANVAGPVTGAFGIGVEAYEYNKRLDKANDTYSNDLDRARGNMNRALHRLFIKKKRGEISSAEYFEAVRRAEKINQEEIDAANTSAAIDFVIAPVTFFTNAVGSYFIPGYGGINPEKGDTNPLLFAD